LLERRSKFVDCEVMINLTGTGVVSKCGRILGLTWGFRRCALSSEVRGGGDLSSGVLRPNVAVGFLTLAPRPMRIRVPIMHAETFKGEHEVLTRITKPTSISGSPRS